MSAVTEIEDVAAAWFAKRDSHAWTERDQEELDAWIAASTAHRVAFIRIEAAWQKAGRLKALGAGVPEGLVPSEGAWQFSPFIEDRHFLDNRPGLEVAKTAPPLARLHARSHFSISARALAASFLLAAILGAGFYITKDSGPLYRTAVGGLETVPLSDGSKVTLNTESEIRIALTDANRTVELRQGEAFFEVAKDPNRPFVVAAGNKRVIAVGTKFSVRREANDIRVAVTEGRVRVEDVNAQPGEPEARLDVGAVARAGQAGTLIEQMPLAEVQEEYLSWRQGYVVFHETTLADAVAEINRYNTRKIEITDGAVANIRIGGNFHATNLDAFVRLLETGFAIHAVRQDNKIILSRN